MNITISKNPKELGKIAGSVTAQLIRETIARKGIVNIILATGASQFETLNQLITEKNIDWAKVTMFHLDEYIGLSAEHPASFRRYLNERFLRKVPALREVCLINGETGLDTELRRINNLIADHPIDIALVGIGENGHLAFNDPPADFEIEDPYIIVNLDEPCRKQQLGEGWFASLEEVPAKAISMSIRQIMKSRHIICSVPDSRKAQAVKNSVEQMVSNRFPASILQTHADCRFYLDKFSAALLTSPVIASETVHFN